MKCPFKKQLSSIEIKGEGERPEWFLNRGKCPVGRDCPGAYNISKEVPDRSIVSTER